ncbi:hypothetical protein BCR42DRAFT_422704 [Absidia repens]|uniref:Pentacotripeptide-repeat region of PRORP domain-containing protein n=1 Tax=Absidia repens TaxID=90262 RepID=A0A1X2I5T1_9FUNG|nr:hypothetical protein BCR42DRAFT_422704 [Absidia repens]
MIYYAKHGEADQCLKHYLQLLESQGKLPCHEALHQLARVLYSKRHLSGFSILHDTLLAYYKLNPPSGRQSRNLAYIYTMFINLIMRQPNYTKKRSPTSSNVRKSQRLSDQSPRYSSSPLPLSVTSSTTSPSMTMTTKTTTIIQLCQEMRELGLTGSPVLYNSLLKFCVMKMDSALATSLYKELVNICPPTKHTYSILLDLARKQKDSGLILQVLDRLELDGIVPDRPMVSTVMLALCDQQQYMMAIEFVDQLARHAPQVMGPQYKSVLMDTLDRHYQQHKRKNKRQQRYLQQQNQDQAARKLQQSMEL